MLIDREYFFTWPQDLIVDKKHEPPTHGIVREGFIFRTNPENIPANKLLCSLTF